MSSQDGEASGPMERTLSADLPRGMTVEVAHRFSELLTVMLGGLEQLHRQPLDDRGRQQLERVEQATHQACELLKRSSPLSNPCPP